MFGALTLVAAGVFAISRVNGGGGLGGAETPEAAGLGLLTALENEDVLGVVDLLLPGERDNLGDPIGELASELERLEVLGGGDDLSDSDGFDVTFEDETVSMAPTGADDIVNLTIGASVSESLIDRLPEHVRDLTLERTETVSLPMTVVQEDGRWYLSAWYTAFELARLSLPGTPDLPVEGVVAVGAGSPEEAMDNVFAAMEAGDLAGLVAAFNPEEIEALQRYAPLFLADAQRELEAAEVRLRVDRAEYITSGSGDARSLTFRALTVTFEVADQSSTFTLGDGCVTIESATDVRRGCGGAERVPSLEGVFDDAAPIDDLRASLEGVFTDFVDPGVVIERIDGAWFVSPLATSFEQLLALARALDRDEVEMLEPALQDVIERLGREQ